MLVGQHPRMEWAVFHCPIVRQSPQIHNISPHWRASTAAARVGTWHRFQDLAVWGSRPFAPTTGSLGLKSAGLQRIGTWQKKHRHPARKHRNSMFGRRFFHFFVGVKRLKPWTTRNTWWQPQNVLIFLVSHLSSFKGFKPRFCKNSIPISAHIPSSYFWGHQATHPATGVLARAPHQVIPRKETNFQASLSNAMTLQSRFQASAFKRKSFQLDCSLSTFLLRANRKMNFQVYCLVWPTKLEFQWDLATIGISILLKLLFHHNIWIARRIIYIVQSVHNPYAPELFNEALCHVLRYGHLRWLGIRY